MRKINKRKKEKIVLLAGILLSFILGFSFSNLLIAKTHLNNTAIRSYNQTEFKPEEPTQKAKTEEKKESTSISSNCPVKGNKNAQGEQIYHIPGGLSYNRVKGTICFQTEEEAKQAGYRKALR